MCTHTHVYLYVYLDFDVDINNYSIPTDLEYRVTLKETA